MWTKYLKTVADIGGAIVGGYFFWNLAKTVARKEFEAELDEADIDDEIDGESEKPEVKVNRDGDILVIKIVK